MIRSDRAGAGQRPTRERPATPAPRESAFMIAKSTPPAALTWGGVTARRMARHALAEPATELSPAGIAGVLCGAHAQVLSAAELSIGRRVAGAARSDVQRALWQERTLVK